MTVSLTIPEFPTGQNLAGIVTLLVGAQPTPQKGVQFYLDGSKYGAPVMKAPYQAKLDTSRYSAGTHSIQAVAVYKTRSSKVSISVTFTAGGQTGAGGTTGATGSTGPIPPRAWPASFLTGPLGSANILPTTVSGSFLGSQFGGIGYDPAAQRAQIVSRQTALGRNYDVIMNHYDGAYAQTFDGVHYCEDPYSAFNTPGGVTQEQYALNNGSYIAVSWSPNATIGDINAGLLDTAFQKYGSYWATYKPHPVMLRMFWEFDLNGFDWTIYGTPGNPTIVYSASDFITAWQRCVQNVRTGGGTNVGFWWCPFEGGLAGGQTGRQTQANYYPGDTYVDWVGTDLYNGPFQSSPLHAGNAEWWEEFNYSAPGVVTSPSIWSGYDLFSSGLAVSGQRGFTGTPRVKPFMVGEHSSTYFNSDANAKKNHWLNIVANTTYGLTAMPHCIGVAFFDEDVHSPSDYDWRVDSNAAIANVTGSADANTLAGFVTMGASSAFRGK